MTVRRKRLLTLLVLGVAVIAFFWFSNRIGQEPIVQGEPITYWLTAGRNHAESYQGAVATMGENDVRYLIGRLEWHPPTLQIKLNRLLSPIFKRSIFSEDRPDYRDASASTLGRIGVRAQSAVPALRKCVEQSKAYQKSNGETWVQNAAIAALIQLEAETLDSCIDKILDKQNTNWNAYAMATLYLGTNAAAGVPRLVNAFSASDNEDIRGRIAIPLRFIRSNPELSVPVLKTLLGHKNDSVRFQAAFGLHNFGPAAMPAWNDLTNLLSDSNKQVREAARLTLKQIDPEAAKQGGRNHPADE
jgi:hypothetical protein